MAHRKVTAIIVGGGPIGLTTALGLTRAGIDFVMLEQRKNVIIDAGSDMTLLPMTMPVLDQLNLLKSLSKVWCPVSQIERIDSSGRPLGELSFQALQESTGYSPHVISRCNLLEVLHHALPRVSQDSILTNKKVSKIQATLNGVTLVCTDDITYEAKFVIGADGAHSAVRDCMRQAALENNDANANDAEPFKITYEALWIRFPTSMLPGCRAGTATETHGSGIATQLFAGDDTATVGVYRKLPAPMKRSLRYTEKDQAALIQEWGSLPLYNDSGVQLRDVYEARLGSGLVSLEEGVLPHWSWNGRIVLVGDAAHKFTPSTGSGLNYGIADAVALTNELCKVLGSDSAGAVSHLQHPSLSEAFQTYQQTREAAVIAGLQEASGATAMSTWSNHTLKVLDCYILSTSLAQWVIARQIASSTMKATFLTFVV